MSHLHGGHYDPNTQGQSRPQVPHDPHGGSYTSSGVNVHAPPASSGGHHGGAYTPGSSVVSHPNRSFTSPSARVVEHTPSPQSPQSNHSITYQPTPPPQAQHFPPGSGAPQHTMSQYNQQTMPQNGQQSGVYPQGGNGQQEGTMEPKGPIAVEKPMPLEPVAPPQAGITSMIVPYNEAAQADKEFPVVLKGSRHFFNPRSVYRWRNPVLYQKSGYVYNDQESKIRHRDFAGRVSHKLRSDRYLHHDDGYLRNMYVDATDEIYEGPGTSTWKRTYVRKVAPLKVRIATWVIDFSYDPQSWNDWWIMILRALPAALAMNFVFWDGQSTIMKRNLCYAPILYTLHGDAKVWSNMLENRHGLSFMARNNQIYRLLRPRYLCFLNNPSTKETSGVTIRSVPEWEITDGKDGNLEYLFVAYSTEQFNHGSEEDMQALHHIAEVACRAAGKSAYWIACSCMRDEDEIESDVYRISDILRGASDMVIAVGMGKYVNASDKITTEGLLRQWGSRMWTFPEVLLSPGRSIKIYTRGKDLSKPLEVPKNQFAAQVWTYMDPDVSRHLVDHYLGNIGLSRLELAVLALRCLYSRETTEYLAGDQAYALMGLLRLRPQIDRTDSAFQAFSRLSLANDSDGLLERYICTLPLYPNQPWYNMEDAYQSSLWDITPYCQVAGIADEDTIIIDGARGLSIRWKTFYPIYWSTGPSWKRFFAYLVVEWSGIVFVLSVTLLGIGSTMPYGGDSMIAVGVIFFLLFIYSWIMTPKLVRTLYGGKFYDTQAEMFGFEGHLNAPTIERALFGGSFGRLSWTTNSSPLSRSVINEFGERIGIDPYKDPEVRMKIEAAKNARPGDMRIFTLVDTYNMELTLFEAIRPPVTLMFCASEGGMQRAIGCSYEWANQTMYRETVLRLPTPCLNRMDRVPRFRLGTQRPHHESHPLNNSVA